MSSQYHPPDQDGAISHENQPQVVVRGGKTYVCSACGTLVEIPAEFVNQFDLVDQAASPREDAAKERTPQPPPASHSAPAEVRGKQCSTRKVEHGSAHCANSNKAQSRPRSACRPPRKIFADTIIDGLRVPSAQKLDRAFAWVSFQLKVVDRQDSEIRRLKKLLRQKPVSRPGPRRQAKAREAPPGATATVARPSPSHAGEDIPTAPDKKTPKGREPP